MKKGGVPGLQTYYEKLNKMVSNNDLSNSVAVMIIMNGYLKGITIEALGFPFFDSPKEISSQD